MISSMPFAALPWEFSIVWIADKESENIIVSVGVELPLSNCCIRVSRVFCSPTILANLTLGNTFSVILYYASILANLNMGYTFLVIL